MAIPMTITRTKNGATAVQPPVATTDGFGPTRQVERTITPGEIMEQVLIKGDLKNLSEAERARYYTRVCESLKLNPLTKPFEYITLNGKLTLYARKDATDQLRMIYGVSVIETVQQEMEGVYIIIAKVRNAEGRTDESRGAVSLTGLKGEALANAIMKTETKAKRRATLSICGLGFLDETEIEDVTLEPKVKGWRNGRKTSAECKRDGTNDVFNDIRRQIASASDLDFLAQIPRLYEKDLQSMYPRWSFEIAKDYELKWSDLGGDPTECPFQAEEEHG